VADAIAGLDELITEGDDFTYGNFASHSPRGYPNAYSGDWLVWTHRINQVLPKMGQSPIANSIARGLQLELIGNDEDDFRSAHALIMSGLRAAQKIFGPDIPASDRTVSLDHNSPEQKQALEKLDELVAAVKETNDFPGNPEEREQVIAELSAGRRLLEATKVRVSAVQAALQPALKWMLEKAGGAVIGKLAGDLWQYLAHLHIF
jgi:hypothetical protein